MKRIYVWKADLVPPANPNHPHKVEINRRDKPARFVEDVKPDHNWVAYERVKPKKKAKKVKK